MNIHRHLVSVLIQLGAFLLCIWMADQMNAGHWGFALSVNFLFMIAFTVIFDKIITPQLLRNYFLTKHFEHNGKIYTWLGVKQYKFILKLIGWGKIIRKNQPIRKSLESLKKYMIWTQGSEAIHLFASFYVFVFTIWVEPRLCIRI